MTEHETQAPYELYEWMILMTVPLNEIVGNSVRSERADGGQERHGDSHAERELHCVVDER